MAGVKIFLADDDFDDASLFIEIAGEVDERLIITHFESCAALIRALEDCRVPDMIFLDLNMPLTDGRCCLGKLKAHTDWKKIPVVIYSSASRTDIIDDCYVEGADLYVVKPNDVAHLQEIFRSTIKKIPALKK